MGRISSLLVAVPLVLGSCGSGGTEPSASLDSGQGGEPGEVVLAMLGALADGRPADAASSVDDRQLALFTFIEGTTGSDVAELIEGGVPEEVKAAFWTSFSDSLPQFSGEPVNRLQVGDVELIEEPEGEYAAVAVAIGATNRASDWVVRKTGEGWTVDLLATFGVAVAPNLWAWSETLTDEEGRETIHEYLAGQRVSLEVARDRADPTLPAAAFEALEALVQR